MSDTVHLLLRFAAEQLPEQIRNTQQLFAEIPQPDDLRIPVHTAEKTPGQQDRHGKSNHKPDASDSGHKRPRRTAHPGEGGQKTGGRQTDYRHGQPPAPRPIDERQQLADKITRTQPPGRSLATVDRQHGTVPCAPKAVERLIDQPVVGRTEAHRTGFGIETLDELERILGIARHDQKRPVEFGKLVELQAADHVRDAQLIERIAERTNAVRQRMPVVNRAKAQQIDPDSGTAEEIMQKGGHRIFHG